MVADQCLKIILKIWDSPQSFCILSNPPTPRSLRQTFQTPPHTPPSHFPQGETGEYFCVISQDSRQPTPISANKKSLSTINTDVTRQHAAE